MRIGRCEPVSSRSLRWSRREIRVPCHCHSRRWSLVCKMPKCHRLIMTFFRLIAGYSGCMPCHHDCLLLSAFIGHQIYCRVCSLWTSRRDGWPGASECVCARTVPRSQEWSVLKEERVVWRCFLLLFPLYSTVAVSFNYLWQWASWILIIPSLVFPGALHHSLQQRDALARSSPLHPKLIGFFFPSSHLLTSSGSQRLSLVELRLLEDGETVMHQTAGMSFGDSVLSAPLSPRCVQSHVWGFVRLTRALLRMISIFRNHNYTVFIIPAVRTVVTVAVFLASATYIFGRHLVRRWKVITQEMAQSLSLKAIGNLSLDSCVLYVCCYCQHMVEIELNYNTVLVRCI